MTAVTSVDELPVPWRLRRDLEIQPASQDAGHGWTIKDPLRLAYFQAQSEELAFLRLLDGRSSLRVIAEGLADRFPASDFSMQNLRSFLISAINGGLLTSSLPGYGNRLAAALRRKQSAMISRKLMSLLTWRFRGIDPTWLLEHLNRLLGWIYHPRMLILCICFILTTAVLVLSRWSQLQLELPDITRLASIDNLGTLAAAIVLIKILHELGHGLTCRHYGGECHELGVLLVAFFPLLYCDVSDSWLQQDRRKRILVTAAGIGVELLLASVCGLLWIFSHPGVLHTFFLNVMLVCSINTVMINGNPLLKYDGYYILSDLLRIPNLAAEARLSAGSVFDRIVLGVPGRISGSRSTWAEFGMVTFGVASFLYRFVVLGSLLWIVYHTLKPHRLEILTLIPAVSVAAGLLFASVQGLRGRYADINAGSGSNGVVRASGGLLLLAIVIGVLILTPWPHTISVPFCFTTGVSVPIFAQSSGFVNPEVQTGSQVEQGQLIARMENPELQLALLQTEAELRLAETRVAVLNSQRSVIGSAANALPAAVEDVEATRRRLESLQRRTDDLQIRSPVAGQLFPPRNLEAGVLRARTQGRWFGTPLDPRNHSAWIEEQTLLGSVGNTQDLRAICLVPQHQVELVQTQAGVHLEFASAPGLKLSGKVTQVKSAPEGSADRELVINSMIAVSAVNSSEPFDKLFAVQVQADSQLPQLLPPLYSTGFAEIECRPMSLARRLLRLIRHTFSFRL